MAVPGVRKFPEDSLEARVYNLVEKYNEYIPLPNDRNRLAYSLIKFIQGEGDSPSILVKSTKIRIEGISSEQLAGKLESEIKNLK
jgi:hypothetical protein